MSAIRATAIGLILWLTGASSVAMGQQPDEKRVDSDRIRLELKCRLFAAEKLGSYIGEKHPGACPKSK